MASVLAFWQAPPLGFSNFGHALCLAVTPEHVGGILDLVAVFDETGKVIFPQISAPFPRPPSAPDLRRPAKWIVRVLKFMQDPDF